MSIATSIFRSMLRLTITIMVSSLFLIASPLRSLYRYANVFVRRVPISERILLAMLRLTITYVMGSFILTMTLWVLGPNYRFTHSILRRVPISPSISLAVLRPTISFMVSNLIFSMVFRVLGTYLRYTHSPKGRMPSVTSTLLTMLRLTIIIVVGNFLLVYSPLGSNSNDSIFIRRVPLTTSILLATTVEGNAYRTVRIVYSTTSLLTAMLRLTDVIMVSSFTLVYCMLRSYLRHPNGIIGRVPMPISVLLAMLRLANV